MQENKPKRIKIYSESGNTVEIDDTQKDFWVGKGYTVDPPKKKVNETEESK